MKHIFFFLLAMLFGCGIPVSRLVPGAETVHPASIVLHADVDFTPSERTIINQAAHIWGAQTGHVASIELVYDLDFNSLSSIELVQHESRLVRLTGDEFAVMMADAQCGRAGCVLGWTTSGGIHNPEREPVEMAFIMNRMDSFKDELLVVALHEMGHALGLPHVASVQSIMYPSVSASRTACLKQEDLVAFCNVSVCGGAVMHPCE